MTYTTDDFDLEEIAYCRRKIEEIKEDPDYYMKLFSTTRVIALWRVEKEAKARIEARRLSVEMAKYYS